MKLTPLPPIDRRGYVEIFEAVRARTPGYTPELNFTPGTVGAALAAVFARYAQSVLQRLNQAPDKNKLAFLDMLGLHLTPAQSSWAPLVFQLNEKASSGIAPAGTAVAAQPPPGSSDQVVFETEEALSVMAGKLTQVVSLWPGRDAFIDHSADSSTGAPMQLFSASALENIPHHLYLAHEKLFALAGRSKLRLEFQLQLMGSAGDPLDIEWEYWDGKVWRTFFDFSPACRPDDPTPPDGTAGLSANGRIELTSEGATSDKTVVAGVSSYWVRGRLARALPSAGAARLPLVDAVRLSSIVEQPYRVTLELSGRAAGDAAVVVRNAAGSPLSAASVTIPDPNDPERSITLKPDVAGAGTVVPGAFRLPEGAVLPATVTILFFGTQQTISLGALAGAPSLRTRVKVDLSLTGLPPDTALADATKLDTTKPFFPFGQQPQPGSTFYVSHTEAFSKPGANLRLYLPLSSSPTTDIASEDPSNGRHALSRMVEWEYWNGRAWAALIPAPSNQGAGDFSKTEVIDFTVPVDMEPASVAGTDGLWVRARLVSGGFGYTQDVKWQAGTGPDAPVNTISYVVSQPPILADIQLSYTWQYGPFHPERVITYNDFRYADRTEEALWPGTTFAPYERTADTTPALYLGFSRTPPAGQIGLFVNVRERRGDVSGPALTWESWNGFGWTPLAARDETRNLRLPGIVSLVTTADSVPLARFDARPLHWIRGRLQDDGPPGQPTLEGIFPNAVWAAQRTTLSDVPIGQSRGAIDQQFAIPQIPILEGERIEVREIAGPRANVEWRILASELFQGDVKVIARLENELAHEGGERDVVEGDLRLRRDRLKKVSEVWVRWFPRQTLAGCGPADRCYTIDRARGLLQFGDGTTGRVPPDGASILGRILQSGGGQSGNVAAGSISQLRGVVVGIDAAFNPVPAEGGADGEPLSEFVQRGPRSLQHRGRAVGGGDYATLAREASSAVGYARAVPTRDPGGRVRPGWVTVLIIPRSRDPRPQPSFGLRRQVQDYLDRRAPAELASDQRIFVVGPDYLDIDVSAVLSPVTASEAGVVEQAAREALLAFLHPLTGGPSGDGWDLGRSVFLSDVAAALSRVPGIDHIENLALLLDGQPQAGSLTVSPGRIAVAGTIHIQLAAPRG